MFSYTNKVDLEELNTDELNIMQDDIEAIFSNMHHMLKTFQHIAEHIISKDIDLYKTQYNKVEAIIHICQFFAQYKLKSNIPLYINSLFQLEAIANILSINNNKSTIKETVSLYINSTEKFIETIIKKTEEHKNKNHCCIKIHCKSYSILCLLLLQYIIVLSLCEKNDTYTTIHKHIHSLLPIIMKIRHIETHFECPYGGTYIEEFLFQN